MASRFIVQAQLKDGSWVWFERQIPRELFDWPMQTLLTLLILLVGVITLSMVAVRWIVRPLDRLREAADALGKDIHRPPLPETGPVEVAETSRAFNTMQRRIARFVEDRARMLAAISHDLRTPSRASVCAPIFWTTRNSGTRSARSRRHAEHGRGDSRFHARHRQS